VEAREIDTEKIYERRLLLYAAPASHPEVRSTSAKYAWSATTAATLLDVDGAERNLRSASQTTRPVVVVGRKIGGSLTFSRVVMSFSPNCLRNSILSGRYFIVVRTTGSNLMFRKIFSGQRNGKAVFGSRL
jgi:hypothetical protein